MLWMKGSALGDEENIGRPLAELGYIDTVSKNVFYLLPKQSMGSVGVAVRPQRVLWLDPHGQSRAFRASWVECEWGKSSDDLM